MLNFFQLLVIKYQIYLQLAINIAFHLLNYLKN